MKRYWSAIHPTGYLSRLSPQARAQEEAFDAQLTPEDVVEMQKIDADCNDCRHFQRGKMFKAGLTGFHGHCAKLDKPVVAWPMQYSGHECFEHRRG